MDRILVDAKRLDNVIIQRFDIMIDTTKDNILNMRKDFVVDNMDDIMLSFIHDLIIFFQFLKLDTRVYIINELEKRIKTLSKDWIKFLFYIKGK